MVIDLSEFKDDIEGIWQLIKDSFSLTETYFADIVRVARGEHRHSATLDVVNFKLETELLIQKTPELLMKHKDSQRPFIGESFCLEDLKAIMPGKYVVAAPLGGDLYRVKDIGDFYTGYNALDRHHTTGRYNGTWFPNIVVYDQEVYIGRTCLGSAGGDALTTGFGESWHHAPYSEYVSRFNDILRDYETEYLDHLGYCVRGINNFIKEMLEGFYKYNEEKYHGELKKYRDIYDITKKCVDNSVYFVPEPKLSGEEYERDFDEYEPRMEEAPEKEAIKEWLILLRGWLVERVDELLEIDVPAHLPPDIVTVIANGDWRRWDGSTTKRNR